jgi:hypothetical protein
MRGNVHPDNHPGCKVYLRPQAARIKPLTVQPDP